jgi:hypothetical protein
VLAEYDLYGDIDLALKAYNDWKISNRIRFPFPGGRYEQPLWVLHNLDILSLLDERAELQRKMNRDARDDFDSPSMKPLEF